MTNLEFDKELEKYNLDQNTYELVLSEISDKMSGLSDLDWSEIIEKYNVKCANDTMRKASQTIFGGYFVSNYLRSRSEKSSTSSMSKAREIVGEQLLLKKQLQAERRDINKFKNEFVKSISIAEELAEIQEREGFTVNVPEYCHISNNEHSQYQMIVHITDWHIGYVIGNCKGNKYNYEIANRRIDKFISEIKKYIKLYDIKEIKVISTGDMIEQVYLRKNQSQFCEFNQSEQINAVIKLLFRFLIQISEGCNVEYDSVHGNHDRTNGDRTANLDGDNAETIIREQLANLVEIGNIKNIKIVDRPHTDTEIVKEVNGILLKAKHGCNSIKDDKMQLKADISMDEEFYDLLLKGHEHNFRVISENKGRYIVSSACLSGFNDYSTSFGASSDASQTIIVVSEGEIELIKDVNLAIN